MKLEFAVSFHINIEFRSFYPTCLSLHGFVRGKKAIPTMYQHIMRELAFSSARLHLTDNLQNLISCTVRRLAHFS